MTEDEKQFLMDLFDRHELLLEAILCLLGSAAARMSIIAIEQNNESLHQVMADKLTVSHIVPAVSIEGPIIHIWCYDREELMTNEQS